MKTAGFKRTTQPIFALAACEHQREIYLSPEELTQFDPEIALKMLPDGTVREEIEL